MKEKKEEADNNMVLVQNATIKYNTLMRELGSGNFLISVFKAIQNALVPFVFPRFYPSSVLIRGMLIIVWPHGMSFQSDRGS